MEAELAALKVKVEAADQRMVRVEDKLDRIIDGLGAKATRQDVWTALGTGAAIAFAVIALFIGVLTYLQDQKIATRPEPSAPAAPQVLVVPWPSSAPPPSLPPTQQPAP